jgi:hypothetical protein
MTYGVYTLDDGVTTFARLVDADEFTQTDRGWTATGVAGLHLLPRAFKVRRVYGVSPTSGRRGTAVVASVDAPLWTGAATTFDVEANDNTTDTMNVTGRRGEGEHRGHA